MKAIFLKGTENLILPKARVTILDENINYYTMRALKQSNIEVVTEIPKTGRVLFLHENMPLLQEKSLRALLATVGAGYVSHEGLCLYWVEASRASLPFEAIQDTLEALPYQIDFLVVRNARQVVEARKILQRRINDDLLDQGVFIMDPLQTEIGIEVEIEPGAIIFPNSRIYGKSRIQTSTTIGTETCIRDVVIGKDSKVEASHIYSSIIGDFSTIGPFAYIRPGSKIGNHVKIGNYVEVKNTTIEEGSKAAHHAYMGDCHIGKHVNIGCGTVVVNYDGKNKHRSTIGDHVFIGCNSILISPVTLGDNAFVAAGSTITEDVPKNGFAIGRTRQENKENYRK